MALLFKKGYLIVISSSENDADARRDLQINIDNLLEVQATNEFLQLSEKSELLNSYRSYGRGQIESYFKIIEQLKLKYPIAILTNIFGKEQLDLDFNSVPEGEIENLCDYCVDTYAFYLGYGDFFTRSFDRLVVYKVDEDTTFESVTL